MRILKDRLFILRVAVVTFGLLGSSFTFAGDLITSRSDSLFVDQLNGMARLQRLDTKLVVTTTKFAGSRRLSDVDFVSRLFGRSSSERLVVAPRLVRLASFNNGRSRSSIIRKRTLAPSGFYRLCKDKVLSVCKGSDGILRTGEDGKVLMNSRLFTDLQSVNLQVNVAIRPEAEQAGSQDNWQVNLNKGDCEDYALTKKAKLVAMGWPSNALLITIVDTEFGERHAVLTVATNRGDYLLDNLLKKVINVEISKYKFISRQGAKGGYSWSRLI